MPTAYTPGLRITEDTAIEKERRLPLQGVVLVKQGDDVEPQTVVARALLEGDLHSFKAAEKLGVDPPDLKGLLKKRIDDRVEKNELLAEVKGFFGLFRSELRAPVEGTIEHISLTTGFIGIRRPKRPIELTAYIGGKVDAVIPEEGVVIRTRGAFIQGIFGVGAERYGTVMPALDSPDAVLTDEHIKPDMKGAVVIGGASASTAALQKAAAVGVAGVVVGALPDSILRNFVGYDIGIAITGQENVPFTLILTEGFGQIPMAARTFQLLVSLAGKTASLNGATQIRAGVIRPEIIVPRENEGQAQVSGPAAAAGEAVSGELAPSRKVRIIREPHLGKLGEVVSLPAELAEIQTGAKVRVAAIRLDDGTEVIVPRANLEIIQE